MKKVEKVSSMEKIKTNVDKKTATVSVSNNLPGSKVMKISKEILLRSQAIVKVVLWLI